jgi:hypothetical protein
MQTEGGVDQDSGNSLEWPKVIWRDAMQHPKNQNGEFIPNSFWNSKSVQRDEGVRHVICSPQTKYLTRRRV